MGYRCSVDLSLCARAANTEGSLLCLMTDALFKIGQMRG